MKRITYIFLFFLIAQFSVSQTMVLKGKIYEKYEGKEVPLEYVSIKIIGNSDGVTTNSDGIYKIECSKGDVVRILYLGYKPIEWTVDDSSNKDFCLEIIENPLENLSDTILN
ncbi:MAG: carboxypeptidase-like regulatory domain-containing protein [Dysgonomonas sp.]